MTKRRFSTSLSALVFGLAVFGLAPSEAKAIEVMCSNEYGQCEVQDNPSWISCSCNNESSTGGTGGDEYQGLSEEELMAVCAAELAYCEPDLDTGLDGNDTFGTSDSGNNSDTGDTNTTEGDSGEGESSTTGDSGTTGADTSTTEGDSGDSGTTGESGDSGTTGDSGDSGTTSDSGESGESGGESSSDGGSGVTAGDEAEDGGTGSGEEDAAADEADGCSVANDSGLGALALFGMFGLLGLRSRKSSR